MTKITVAELEAKARKSNGSILWEKGQPKPAAETVVLVVTEGEDSGEIYSQEDASGSMALLGRCF
jgi:hypothetical protein